MRNRKIWIALSGLVLGVILYLLVGTWLQPAFDRTVQAWLPLEERLPVETYERLAFNLDAQDAIQVEALVHPEVKLSIANQSPQGLLDDVVSEEDLLATSSSFAFSPKVEEASARSWVQKERLLARESFNALEWYEVDGQERLYQKGQPYTGWHDQTQAQAQASQGWQYFQAGYPVDHLWLSLDEVDTLAKETQFMTELLPVSRHLPLYLTSNYEHTGFATRKDVHYSILHQSPDNLIFSSPPGTEGSRLVARTEDYGWMPMEIIQEVHTPTGTWLKATIGYEDLGWLKKDTSQTHYVLTDYSERELLDRISQTLEEGMAQIDAQIGASFIHHETMAQVSVNNQIFFPASTQKIYALAELYHQYKLELRDPYEVIVLEASDKVPGAGIIQGSPDGSEFYLDELVDLVATYSDNTAANLLMETVGGGSVMSPHMHQIGLYDTYVYGLYYHGLGEAFYTTPADAARLFALMYNDRLNGDPYDTWLIEKLSLNTHNFLRNYIPGTTQSWNKSGLGDTEQNDVASFVTPYGSYTLAVYTAEPAYYGQIPDQLGWLSSQVHQTFEDYLVDYPALH